MLQPSRLLICVLLAMGALVVSATAASARGHPHQAAAPVSGAAATGCDVPGAACDPSKTTLDLMEYLLTQPDVKHLLLIGAYRDNELDPAHPLMRKLAAMRQA